MKKEGFKIKTIDTNEVNVIKQKAGLQAGQTSCHTAFVDGYIVEGHVNYSAIKKMLQEKPDILGISVPGMPIGSPHYRDWETDRKSTRLNSSHRSLSRMPSSA